MLGRVIFILYVKVAFDEVYTIICTAQNAPGETKLVVLIATVVSVSNGRTAFTAVHEHSEV